ncbi:hypothetical protein [Dechloromonas sp. HYN0024]|uniref:hypothetical protein n=1 Tax=Dechloromonas sp. HYN0024 TaxID=2231055 RepID=UPI000E4382A5|nr:hypothetical protein [Dechloromonas sp. HYN0024]AXS80097.1 hypothetical protein HYN24_08750 [Dechloromonas sp. HYN0024]
MTQNLTPLFIACLAGSWLAPAFADEHHHVHRFPKDVDAFHAVLAPIWHSAPGKERLQAACAKAGQMDVLAKAVRSGDAAQLVGAVAALNAQCQTNSAGVEAAFGDVHDAFHHLIEPRAAGKAG